MCGCVGGVAWAAWASLSGTNKKEKRTIPRDVTGPVTRAVPQSKPFVTDGLCTIGKSWWPEGVFVS